MEEWKDIKEYEGLYQVSSYGKVRSLPKEWVIGKGGIKKHDGMILKPGIQTMGYYYVNLYKNKKIKFIAVHRLVAKAFIQNDDNNLVVNHIDGNKINNNSNNLEWISQKANIEHALDNNLTNNKGEKNGKSKLTEKEVLEIRSLKLSYGKLAKLYNVSPGTIYQIIKRLRWKYI
jgi:hypothetical protein